MNPSLHHKWNAERTATRGSDKEGPSVEEKQLAESKVTLKQVGPNKGKTDRET